MQKCFTLLLSERTKLHRVLAAVSAIGLRSMIFDLGSYIGLDWKLNLGKKSFHVS